MCNLLSLHQLRKLRDRHTDGKNYVTAGEFYKHQKAAYSAW